MYRTGARSFGRALGLFIAPPHISRALHVLAVVGRSITGARPFGRALGLFVAPPYISRISRALHVLAVVDRSITCTRPFGRAVGLFVAFAHVSHISHALRTVGMANALLDAFHFERNVFELLGVLRTKPFKFVDLAFLSFDIPFRRVGACAGSAHIRVDVDGGRSTVRDTRLESSFHGTVAFTNLAQWCSELLEFFRSRAIALDAFTAVGIEDFPRTAVDPGH